MIMKLTETEASQIVGGQPGLHMELLTEKERVLVVRALRRLHEETVIGDASLEVVDLLMKLANPAIAVWVQHS